MQKEAAFRLHQWPFAEGASEGDINVLKKVGVNIGLTGFELNKLYEGDDGKIYLKQSEDLTRAKGVESIPVFTIIIEQLVLVVERNKIVLNMVRLISNWIFPKSVSELLLLVLLKLPILNNAWSLVLMDPKNLW